MRAGFHLDRDAKIVSKEVYELFKEKYGVEEKDTYKDVYRTLAGQQQLARRGLAIDQLYSFASAEEVRLVIQVPILMDKPDRVLVFDAEGKTSMLGGVLPPPPPSIGAPALAPALPPSVQAPAVAGSVPPPPPAAGPPPLPGASVPLPPGLPVSPTPAPPPPGAMPAPPTPGIMAPPLPPPMSGNIAPPSGTIPPPPAPPISAPLPPPPVPGAALAPQNKQAFGFVLLQHTLLIQQDDRLQSSMKEKLCQQIP